MSRANGTHPTARPMNRTRVAKFPQMVSMMSRRCVMVLALLTGVSSIVSHLNFSMKSASTLSVQPLLPSLHPLLRPAPASILSRLHGFFKFPLPPVDRDHMVNPQMPCKDCGVNTISSGGIGEYYMVEDRVWLDAGMDRGSKNGGGYLCIGCLEMRLGRPLTSADFMPNTPINDPRCPIGHPRSERLLLRLSSSASTGPA